MRPPFFLTCQSSTSHLPWWPLYALTPTLCSVSTVPSHQDDGNDEDDVIAGVEEGRKEALRGCIVRKEGRKIMLLETKVSSPHLLRDLKEEKNCKTPSQCWVVVQNYYSFMHFWSNFPNGEERNDLARFFILAMLLYKMWGLHTFSIILLLKAKTKI